MMGDPTTQAIAELHDVVRCRCHKAYTDRGLRDPSCECDSADAVNVVESEITALRAQLAAAEADKLAAMERVRDAVLAELIANMVWMPKSRRTQAKAAIRALKLDALAEGEK